LGIDLGHVLTGLREPWRKVFFSNFRAWVRDRGDVWRLRWSGLGPGSTAFDFGGYRGDWAAAVHAGTGARVEVFEPHPTFAAGIAARFKGNDALRVHAFALGSTEATMALSDAADASSAVAGADGPVVGHQRTVVAFFDEFGDRRIGLAKINIEGGEYDLLPALIAADRIGQIDLIQVQFHLYKQSDIARRDAIRAALQTTHRCDWCYDFVWEQWSLR